ncbi:hypothetical protein NEOKW01_1800 [Nematocida sp. AWRm80]|nr:hypothetical protein NEOKW01_1800 [Nematocida sp. AWRm80]
MIESIALRKFVVSYFLVYPTKPLALLVNRIANGIKGRFFKGEIVFIKQKELTGCVVSSTPKGYIVEIYDNNQSTPLMEEVLAEDLLRKDTATKNEVLSFLLSVTRETPFGRVILGSAVQDLGVFKGQKAICATDALGLSAKPEPVVAEPQQETPKPAWGVILAEKKKQELLAQEEKRMTAIKESVLKIPRTVWSPTEKLELNQRILSTYAIICTFKEFFKTESITLEKFIELLYTKSPGQKYIADLYSKLIKSIASERRKIGKDGLRDMIQVAYNVFYVNPEVQSLLECIHSGEPKDNTRFNRIQWFIGDITTKNYQQYMKSFIYDLIHVYQINIKTVEFAPCEYEATDETSKAIDRLLVISFLLEIYMVGIRFRSYFDTAIEEYKEQDRERNNLVLDIRRLKGEIIISGTTNELKEQLAQTQKALAELDQHYHPEIVRTCIGAYNGITFYMINHNVFYFHENQYYQIQKTEWESLISLFNTDKKKDIHLYEQFKRFMRMAI